MQTEHRCDVEIVVLNYVKDFAVPEDCLREHVKVVMRYNIVNKTRKDNYIQSLKDVYGNNCAMWVCDKSLLGDAVTKGFTQEEQEHWLIRDKYRLNRSKNPEIKQFRGRTKFLRDKVRRILKSLASKLFLTVTQLGDASDKLEDADQMEADEEDVLEGDNDNSSVDKDSEIEKLKKEVVDLTRGFEKEIVDLTEKHKESSFFYREMYNKFQRGLKYDPTVDLPSNKRPRLLNPSNVLSPVQSRNSSQQIEEEEENEVEEENCDNNCNDLCHDFSGNDN